MTEQADLQRQPFQEGSLQQRREVLLGTTMEALAEADLATLRLVLNNQHPADLAELLRVLDEEDQQTVLQLIAEPLAARALAESDTPTMLIYFSIAAGLLLACCMWRAREIALGPSVIFLE